MAIPKQISPVSSLFGPCPHWPRWRAAKVTAAFNHTIVDSTYSNLTGPGTPLTTIDTGGGTVIQSRWQTPRDDIFPDMLVEEGQYSDFPEEGGLYTARGFLTFDDRIPGPVILGSASVGLSWEIHPAIPVPPGPVLGRLMRGRGDVRTHRMPCPLAGLGAFFSWGATDFTNIGPGQTIISFSTAFEDIDFNLENLTSTAFSWEKTLSNTLTYTPPPDDPGIGYYPTRGSLVTTGLVTCTLEFTV
jgi:hypothetical protein